MAPGGKRDDHTTVSGSGAADYVLLLANVKNVFGILVIAATGLVIFDFARYGTVGHATMAAYGIA